MGITTEDKGLEIPRISPEKLDEAIESLGSIGLTQRTEPVGEVEVTIETGDTDVHVNTRNT